MFNRKLMEFKKLNSAQVTTLRDFPVYSAKILNDYFRTFESGHGEDMPPCPVIHKDFVVPYFEEPLNTLFQKHIRQNPQAEYFLLDGSHRTTAANLTRNMIKVMLLATDENAQEAKQMKWKGKLYNNFGLKETIRGIIMDLVDHFRGTKIFQTVQQKTDRMADEEVIPQHMIKCHRK